MLLILRNQNISVSPMTFDWNAKAVWVGATNSGYNRSRLYSKGISTIYYSPQDAGAQAHIAGVRSEGRVPGIYSDPHWYGLSTTPAQALQYRKQLSADTLRLLHLGEPVMVDFELVDSAWVQAFLWGLPSSTIAGWRGKGGNLTGGNNPTRDTGYTNMPFQNGSVVPIADIVSAGMHWYPQLYYGNMSPADAAAVTIEPARWNFPADKIHPFYDGALYASDQRDGAYFTAERLPGMFGLARRLTGASRYTKTGLRSLYTR